MAGQTLQKGRSDKKDMTREAMPCEKQREKSTVETGGWEDGSQLRAQTALAENKFDSQHPHWAACNHLLLPLQGKPVPLLVPEDNVCKQ